MRQTWSPPTYTEEGLHQGELKHLRAYYMQFYRKKNSALDRAHLKDAFVNFDNLTHITITPVEATPKNNRFLEMTGIAPHPHLYENGKYLIPNVIASLKAAKASIRYLEIDTGRNQYPLWDEAVFETFLYGGMNEYLVPFAGLEKLCITNVGRWNSRPLHPGSFLEGTKPLAKLLETSPLLKELTLGLHKSRRNLYSINMIIPATLKIAGLRSLTLYWFTVKEKSLFQILDTYRLTLRTLNLHNITLSRGSWSSLALAMRNRLELTDAIISRTRIQNLIVNPNGSITATTRMRRSCFAFHRDPTLAMSLDDYITHKIDYDPITRATDTGYQVEPDDWLPGTAAKVGWAPKSYVECQCNRHMQIPDL
ncbi:hypothetical protein MMC34_006128 [Xylographa carneopallida]|nr:hypothetical protein [Xylographa carneopallida]